jgi:topoisomerase-4 subunit A
MKNKKEIIEKPENIIRSPMDKVMIEDFNRYAKAVLLERAIPDSRDGLKPVQRRIIYGMYREGNTFDKQTRKCATTVGYVMGNYHPHGDASIYDALVRLSQDWKMEVPLIDFQGNNGSIDNDPAAASRYTEARLAKVSSLLIDDIDKNTVLMQLNFSDEKLEPTVLPARFPNLLVNGANGIAVGAVTNIPTHNLGEVIDATIHAIKNKCATVKDIRKYILGPDFPTGGIIDQPDVLDKLYETGSGSFYVHSQASIDEKKNLIVITGIPYGVVKSDFVAAIDKKRISNKIDNIVEIRDESTDEVRIVIEIKENQDPKPILSFLRNKGILRTTFSANMLAIDKGHPKVMNVLEIINSFIDHQISVITNRSKFDLEKSILRLDVVEGLIHAVDIIDEVIAVIKASNGKAESKQNIMDRFNFSANQAEAIVMLNLYKISNLDYTAYIQEKKSLEETILDLQNILNQPEYLDQLLIKDLKEIKKLYATPRRTEICDDKIKTVEVDATNLIAKEDVHVVLTKDGYVKRVNIRSYNSSTTGNFAGDLPKIKQGDGIVLNQLCSTHDGVIAFLASGTYIYMPVHQIPEEKWKNEGKHLNVFMKLAAEDTIVNAFVIKTFETEAFFVLSTVQGKIKRSKIKDYVQTKLTTKSIKAIDLAKGDKLNRAKVSSGNSDLIICQENGYISCYNENDVPVVGIKAGGVKAINLGKDRAPVADLVVLDSDEHTRLLIVADQPAVRIIMSTNVDVTTRLGVKQSLVKIFKTNPLKIISLSKFDKVRAEDNLVAVYTQETNEVINIDELQTVLPGTGIRPNLDSLKDKIISGIHEDGGVIDENLKIEIPQINIEETKAKTKDGTTQLSLFDLFDDEK